MDVLDVLFGMVDELGLAITVGVLPLGWWGAYSRRDRLITIAPGLTMRQRKLTLAHELGHAVHGHSGFGHVHQEREARAFAAKVLVDPRDYRRGVLEGVPVREIARRQDVPPQAVRDYEQFILGPGLVVDALGGMTGPMPVLAGV